MAADECYTLGGPDLPERPDLALLARLARVRQTDALKELRAHLRASGALS